MNEKSCHLRMGQDTAANATCRVCRKSSALEGLIYLFNADKSSLRNKLDFGKYFSKKISSRDGLPKYLCNGCRLLLEEAHEFKMICNQSERLSRDICVEDNVEDSRSTFVKDEEQTANQEILPSIDMASAEPKNGTFLVNCNNEEVDKPKEPKLHCCKNCSFTARNAGALRLHMEIHADIMEVPSDRPYICEICGKSFLIKNSLLRHDQVHIANKALSKKFSCAKCDYTTRHRCDLKVHTRSHTGERPYECTICHNKFTTLSNLHKHIRNLHNQE